MLLISGSRGITDYKIITDAMNYWLHEGNTIQHGIVLGGAKGVDTLGQLYAEKHNIKLKVIKADWENYPISAGYNRNHDLLKYTDSAVVVWDGQSRGTRHMISLLTNQLIPELATQHRFLLKTVLTTSCNFTWLDV
jgi:hypothetical protein